MKKIFLAVLILTLAINCFAANEIWFVSDAGQTNLKATICQPELKKVYDTTDNTFKATSAVAYGDRDLTVTEDTDNLGVYNITAPAGLTVAGAYLIRVYATGDGTLDVGDLTIPQGGNFVFNWSGSAETIQGDIRWVKGDAQSVTDWKDLIDTGYDPVAHIIRSQIIKGKNSIFNP